MTAIKLAEQEAILCVGDTTFLDYGIIRVKRQGYGPTGNGGNGLILHSALAVDPELGQPTGLLWQKLWNREPIATPRANETPKQKKQRIAQARKVARQRPFEAKESYRWVEALTTVEAELNNSTRVIHVFDRKGDIAEVFDCVRQRQHTGVLVRAADNRSLNPDTERLWAKLEAQPIQFEQVINLPETATQVARIAKLIVRFCQVNLRTPHRFDKRDPLKVYAVYATEVDCPEGVTSLSWLLLTTEAVVDAHSAATIVRWYSYRWRVEEYHKLLKSGLKVESYRLAAEGMKTLLGFLSVIATQLLQLTYLHRTQPNAPIDLVLNSTQVAVLKTKSLKPPKFLTVAWALEAVARLGGYLEHRRNSPIGIQVLWRGWSKLHELCEGWQLATQT